MSVWVARRFLCDTMVSFSGALSAFPVTASSDAEGVWDLVLSTSAGESNWECLAGTTLIAGTITISQAGCQVDADCPAKCELCNLGTNTCDSITGCCVTDADCDDGIKCTDDICDLVNNTCSNDPIAGCCASDNECPLGPCVNGECVTCPTPLVEVIGSRYLAVTPSEDVPEVAILVSGAQSEVDCVSGYVSTSGIMRADPVYQPPGPAGWDTVFVFGEELTGGMTYDVYADCDASSPGSDPSAPATVTMWRWGDTDGNATVNIIDAVKALDVFSSLFHTIPCGADDDCFLVPPAFFCDPAVGRCLWATVQNTDIISETGCTPNGVASIFDVLNILDAFAGLPDPCFVSCP